jgi:hypothetical protein
MTEQEFKSRFKTFSAGDQALFLVRLAADLTVEARGTYIPQSEDVSDPSRLRMFNEAQHRILFQALHLLQRDSDRYPDDVFADVVWDYLIALDCTERLDATLRIATTV